MVSLVRPPATIESSVGLLTCDDVIHSSETNNNSNNSNNVDDGKKENKDDNDDGDDRGKMRKDEGRTWKRKKELPGWRNSIRRGKGDTCPCNLASRKKRKRGGERDGGARALSMITYLIIVINQK